MENAKELRSKKANVKSKLMGAVSMLVVSAIMLSSTTYAWFTLSTAPEVSGMSTTVGANGSLEIALMDYNTADTTQITSGVGDSSANKDVKESNKTWGNIVELNNTYGLNDVTLYPAALNMNASDNSKVIGMDNMLKYAKYGTDGRVAELATDTFSAKYNTTWQGSAAYGVRAIGTGTQADPAAYAFEMAKTNYRNAVTTATSLAKTSLTKDGSSLSALAVKQGVNDSATFTADEVKKITDAKTNLTNVNTQIEKAIQYAYEAYMISTEKKSDNSYKSVDLATIKTKLNGVTAMAGISAMIDAHDAIATELNDLTVGAPSSGTDYTWDDISGALNKLIDSTSLTVNGSAIADIKPAAKAYIDGTADTEQTKLVEGLMNSPKVVTSKGVYSDVAAFVDSYTSDKFDLPIRGVIKATGATLTAQKAATPTSSYFTTLSSAVTSLPDPNNGNKTAIQNVNYGYAVDLAFRTSAAGNLQLSPAVNRVDGAAETIGGGSVFDLTTGDATALGKALRVVFVDTSDNTILGVAGIAASDAATVTPTDGTEYALHMYDYTIDENGSIKLNSAKADDTVTALTATNAKAITALVYLDGGYVDYAMDGIQGTLNLQFKSDQKLTPMSYKDWKTKTTSGQDQNSQTTGDSETTGSGAGN